MTPDRAGPLSCWHCGGSIERRSGALSQQRAMQLLDFYVAEVLAGLRRHDSTAARFCARTARELIDAILAAEAWQRSARAVRVRPRGDF